MTPQEATAPKSPTAAQSPTLSQPSTPTEPARPSITLADLVATPVFGPDGRKLGKVIDLEIRPLEGFRVAALVVGRFSFLGRFALVRGTTPELENVTRPRIIPWADVERFDGRGIVLRRAAPEPGGSGG